MKPSKKISLIKNKEEKKKKKKEIFLNYHLLKFS